MQKTLRLTTALIALGAALAVALAPLSSPATDGRAIGPAVAAGVAGTVFVAIGFAGWASSIGWGVFLLAGGYGLSLIGHGQTFDRGSIVVATALVLVAEAAYWSLDARVPGAAQVAIPRLLLIVGVTSGALIVGAAIEATVAVPDVSGLGMTAAGAAAAVSLLAFVHTLVRRESR